MGCALLTASLVNLGYLEYLEQPNPHPLLLAIQRLYHGLSHGFQRIAVDVLQVIV